MGLEAELKQEIRMTRLRKAILATVQIAGIITLTAMAPNMLSLLGKVPRRNQEKLKSAVRRLQEKDLLHVGPDGIRLTAKGERYIHTTALRPVQPWLWDKKWRVVIFDIPEKKKKQRNLLRYTLIHVGFQKLQNSVWVYPYDCEELILLLKTDYRLGKEVLYMIVDKIERDLPLKKHFELT